MMNEKPLARSPRIQCHAIGYNGDAESSMTYTCRFDDAGRINAMRPQEFQNRRAFHLGREDANGNAVATYEFPNHGRLCIKAKWIADLEQRRLTPPGKQSAPEIVRCVIHVPCQILQ